MPQWVLDEASGRSPSDIPWRAWSPADPGAGAAGRRRGRRTVGFTLLLGLVVAAALLNPLELGSSGGPGNGASWPTPGFEAADAPLGSPIAAPDPGGPHAFVAVQADGVRPVAYDPCRPVHYVIRPDHAPAGGDALVHEAFARISSVTGLQFVYDGATDEVPSSDRDIFQPERYGDRWAPVLVSWQTEAESPEFVTDLAGRAGSARVSPPGGPQVFVSGAVDLDAADFTSLLADQTRAAIARGILLHELGHLVGLAHVSDPGQLLYPTTSTVLDFAAGDLTGLAELGRGECVPGV